MAEIPKKMVVGSELERNLIFQSLMKMKQPISVAANNIEYRGIIEKFGNDLITVKMQSPQVGEFEGNCRINFIFNNNYHYFDSPISKLDENTLVLRVPESINKNILRKFERVDVSGKVFMKIKIMIQSSRREFMKSSLMDERVIIQEVEKPKPAVDKILAGIKHLVSEFSQNFQVKIFKLKENLTFEEQLVKETKKVFLIYDSYEDTIEDKRFSEEQVLTIGGAYDYLIKRGEPRKSAEGKLIDVLQQRRNQRVYSECYVPMLLEGEVVGYIRLINDVDYHRSIKPAFLSRTFGYASILVEALVKYNYFSLDSGVDFDIPIINVSGGGLLFKLDKPKLKQYLIINTVLQMSVLFPARQIEVKGIILRIDGVNQEYCIKFQEINQEDMKFIEDIANKKIPL